MLLLLAIGFVAGIITAVSPCVLPVLPIVFAGSAATEGRRSSYAIVAGLVASFTVFTLTAGAVLSALGLPADLLRNLAIAMLFVLAATLVFPRFALVLERPLAFLSRRRSFGENGGFLLGVSLGLVFVPCAGPVLATISVLSAQHRFSLETVLLTLSYALGVGVVLLGVALGGQRVARPLRMRGLAFRRAMGVVVAAGALAIVFDLDQSLQTKLGSYTGALQKHVEETSYAHDHLAGLRGGTGSRLTATGATTSSELPEYGTAPDFRGISHWLNTPGDRPLTIAGLRGKVVLVDFWTYSCINCLRTLPHLRALYTAYHRRGLEIVGVHTPEFAFEHVLSNVRGATKDLHVDWPVALDNGYETWNAYSNEYWPAEYLIDRTGHLRRYRFGEGDYAGTAAAVRQLLGAGAGSRRPATVADATPTEVTTPETYLGSARLDPSRYRGTPVRPGVPGRFVFPEQLARDGFSYSGGWTVGAQRAVAGPGARIRLHFHARDVYVVLGGHGRVSTLVDGHPTGAFRVDSNRLYTAVRGRRVRDAVLELRFTPGVDAYSFTFG